MKKTGLLLTALLLLLPGCSDHPALPGGPDELVDGVYRAERRGDPSDPFSAGGLDYLVLTVEGGVITGVDCDFAEGTGARKGEPGTEAVEGNSGWAGSSRRVKVLYDAALRAAENGGPDVVTVED